MGTQVVIRRGQFAELRIPGRDPIPLSGPCDGPSPAGPILEAEQRKAAKKIGKDRHAKISEEARKVAAEDEHPLEVLDRWVADPDTQPTAVKAVAKAVRE